MRLFFFFGFIVVTFLISYPQAIEIGIELYGATSLVSNTNFFAILAALSQVVEFIPIALCGTFILKGYEYRNSGIIFFAESKGYPWLKKTLRKYLMYSCALALLVSSVAGFIIPRMYHFIGGKVKNNVFERFLSNPKPLFKNKYNRVGNFHVYQKDFQANDRGWKIEEPLIFLESKRGGIKRTWLCEKVDYLYELKSLNGHNCYQISSSFTFKIKFAQKIKLSKHQVREKYNEYLSSKQIVQQYPYYIAKYTYSSYYLVDYLLNKACPGGEYELIDRLFYFLSFWGYVFIGFIIALYYPLSSKFEKVGFFFIMVLLLPAIPFYFRINTIATKELRDLLEIGYFWPTLGSIILISLPFVRELLLRVRKFFLRFM